MSKANTATAPTGTSKKRIDIAEVSKGDVFSESSHYVYVGKVPMGYQFRHLESDKLIVLDVKYVEELLTTADQYHEDVEVGREDKFWTKAQIDEAVSLRQLPRDVTQQPREGDVRVPGIRSIWANIYSSDVFTVCFEKQDKAITKAAHKKLLDKQKDEALDSIEKARNKVSAAALAIEQIQANPILPSAPGERRELRGYKTQFSSVNGMYDVVDMEINELRKVNVNTIKWLIFGGVKYNVK